jgi:two-component system, NtrC family, sensor kinase
MAGNPLIMVVDDEPDILFLVEIYLKRCNFEVECHKDPAEALASFKKNSQQYSLVLTDLRMPTLSGTELARQMLKIKPDASVAMMTAYDVTEDQMLAVPTIGRQGIIKKPFVHSEICEFVRNHLKMPDAN